MQLNIAGTLLATASDKGTLIRIFSTEDGSPLQEVRRGSDKAEIYSIAFDKNTHWIACSSDKGTIHIFHVSKTLQRITLSDENKEEEDIYKQAPKEGGSEVDQVTTDGKKAKNSKHA